MSKILIIEDDPYVQRMYKRLFTLGKYEVELSPNGKDGIEKSLTINPNLILIDIVLPDINGLEVLKKIKDNPKTKDIPVLMVTNVGEDTAIEKAKALGAESYMIKANFTPSRLLKNVEKYLK